MKRQLHFFLTAAFVVLIAFPSLSQKIIFNRIFPAEGKTFEHVTGIVQDQQGYMWFASKKGLYKYDGYHMTLFKSNPLNSNSLINNNLESVCVDSAGIIWIGSLGKGLDRLDPATGNFTHFHHNPRETSSLANDTVAALLCAHDGTLWVGTHEGLDRFDEASNKFTHYRYDAGNPATISNNQVRAIYEDRQQTLWIGTGSPFPDNGGIPGAGGLNRFDKKAGTFTRYLHDPANSNSLINNKVRAIFEDAKGTFWVGTGGNELSTMNRASGTFRRQVPDTTRPGEISLPRNSKISNFSHVTFITADGAGGIWIGTFDAGLHYYNPKTRETQHYGSFTDSAGEFNGNSAWCGYTSRDGVLWISNLQGNLYRIDPFQKRLTHTNITFGAATSFYQDPKGILWIGSEHGLIGNDLNNKSFTRFGNNPANSTTLSNDIVMNVKADRKGRIWVGTQGGLNLFNEDKETFTRYEHDPKNTNSLSDNLVFPIYEDRHQNFWIGTFKGLDLLDRETGLFTHHIIIQNDTTKYGSNLVTSILEDRHGKIWAGVWGQNGVNLFNRETGKFENYLKGVDVTSIREDADGVLWAGGEDGLYRYDQAANIFTRFTDPSSLTGIPDVASMEEDDKKNLWLGTSIGIIKLNAQRNETTIYGENYGVRGNTLLPTSSYKGLHGQLFFGDTSGYFAFFPDSLTKNPAAPQIILTSFNIANNPVAPGNDAPYDGLLWKTTQIKLNHNQNLFSFDFISIDYSNPEANRSLYTLENYDDEWRIAEQNGRAYYFNVPPGKYIFKIKSSNSYGVWSQKEIAIIITPPWWRRWWAYLVAGFLFVCIIWGIIYYRSRSLIREKHSLEKKINIRTAEVVKQKEEISIQRDNLKQALDELKATQTQLIQREKMASLGELTAGIAHEIQNPLNFVNNFSEVNTELIEELKNEVNAGNKEEAISIADNIKDNEQKIVYHGKRADGIVKGMLQHSRTNTNQKELTDVNALAEEYLRLSYHGLRAKDKSFNATMQTDFDSSIGKLNVISQDIGRVLLNLITNAFYAVNEKKKLDLPGYEPTVWVGTKKEGNKVEIIVRDNGMGIPQKILGKIFHPFFTTKPTGQGTGLGLSLSYDIVKAHGGELKVQTKEGEFAEFIIILLSSLKGLN